MTQFHQASERMRSVQTPVVPVVADLIRNNPGTISLGQGVVYYGPPASAIATLPGLLKAEQDMNKYGPTAGQPELRQVIRDKLAHENGIVTGPENTVIVSAGANMAFLNTLFAITNPGDEVLLTLPYYFNHEMAIKMLNCTPVCVPADKDYQLQPDVIRAAITENTRAIVTVSPNNPSGAVYSEESLREINRLCRKHGLYHISDEAYEYFTYDGDEHFSPGRIEGASEYTVSLYSLSKAYGIASWRVGYLVLPAHLESAVIKAQDTNLICPSLAGQHLALEALQAGANYCQDKIKIINNIRNMFLQELKEIRSFCRIPASTGAFYLFLQLDTERDDRSVIEELVRRHHVALIPGSSFGMEKGCYLRVAYGALDTKTAGEGIKRLTHGLKSVIQ